MNSESRADISASTMIPALLAAYPQARVVLDKYGLRGCGGMSGPEEDLAFFARAHDIDLHHLLRELEAAAHTVHQPAQMPTASIPASDKTGAKAIGAAGPEQFGERPGQFTDSAYKWFFLTGILVALTAGATWGALLLWRIGFASSFTGAPIHEINAHAQAQVSGWMGFFIMGFAYQAFPRFWHTDLAWTRLMFGVFLLMITGVVGASIATAIGPGCAAVATGFAGLQLLAVLLFCSQLCATFTRSGRAPEPYIAYLFIAGSWLVLSAAYNTWHTWITLTAPGQQALAQLVSIYQEPLRDMQFHGVGMTIIFGVGLRTLPHLFGLSRRMSARRSWTVLALITGATCTEILFYLIYRRSGETVWANLLLVPWLAFSVATALYIKEFRLWRPFPEPEPAAKFIRAAYAWLLLSFIMLLCVPIDRQLTHLAASHAYNGAVRHAITVGFISLMIMGYAAKVTATLNGIPKAKQSSLYLPFILINAGCLLRVVGQTATDFNPQIFRFLGISGTLEVAAFILWSYQIISMIFRGSFDHAPAAGPPAEKITADNTPYQVLSWYPHLEPIFTEFGFAHVTRPALLRTLGRQVTFRQACNMHGVDLDSFLASLNNQLCKNDCSSCACSPDAANASS